MREGESDGLDGTGMPVADDRVLDTPNCPDCLVRMEAEESPRGAPYWVCTECGSIALA